MSVTNTWDDPNVADIAPITVKRDDGIGVAIRKTDMCVPWGSGLNHLSTASGKSLGGILPLEYEWTGCQDGNCKYVSANPPWMHVDPVWNSIDGGYPTYRRKEYSGEPYPCCINRPDNGVYDGKTCDVKYSAGPSAPACVDSFKTFCSGGSKIFSDPLCREFGTTFPSQSFELKRATCMANPFSDDCIAWAASDEAALSFNRTAVENNTKDSTAFTEPMKLRRGIDPTRLSLRTRRLKICSSPDYRGHCNSAAIPFCKAIADGSLKFETEVENTEAANFCKCINSPVNKVIGKTYDPECIDAECATLGYKTTKQQAQCNIISCEVVYDISKVGEDVKFLNNDIVMACGENVKQEDIDALQAELEKQHAEEAEAAARMAAQKLIDAEAALDTLKRESANARELAIAAQAVEIGRASCRERV